MFIMKQHGSKTVKIILHHLPAWVQNFMCFTPTVISLLASSGFHFTTNILSLWPLKEQIKTTITDYSFITLNTQWYENLLGYILLS